MARVSLKAQQCDDGGCLLCCALVADMCKASSVRGGVTSTEMWRKFEKLFSWFLIPDLWRSYWPDATVYTSWPMKQRQA